MNTYCIRCLPTDFPEVLKHAITLGVIMKTEEGVTACPGFTWDFIGVIPIPTGRTIKVDGLDHPETVLAALDGIPYTHANIYTEIDLGEVARASKDPEIQLALKTLSRYILTDTDGKARTPDMPYRVLAGQ